MLLTPAPKRWYLSKLKYANNLSSMVKYLLKHLAVIPMSFVIPVASATQSTSETQELTKHASSCAAYFFSAARAKEMTEYETLYDAGEYAFNLAVAAVDEATALQHFNLASTHINQVMQKRWTDFYKVEEQYATKCEKLLLASQQLGKSK